MSLFERIINTILFEISAIIVGIIGVRFFTETDATHAAGVTVVMSLMAATWAFIYNYGFDRIFTGPREDRTPLQRIIHAVDLEGGLLLHGPIHCLRPQYEPMGNVCNGYFINPINTCRCLYF